MNKKTFLYVAIGIIVLVVIIVIALNNKQKPNSNYGNIENNKVTTESNDDIPEESSDTSIQKQVTEKTKEVGIDMIKIKVNNNVLEVKLEDNDATKSLVERLENGDISVNAKEYGGFEKVGNLGFNLPRTDASITTSAGDIVLYQGNQISLFYNTNSWSYTKLGKIQNVSSSELKEILGSGDVVLILSLN